MSKRKWLLAAGIGFLTGFCAFSALFLGALYHIGTVTIDCVDKK